jgi:hypothetical protein
MAVRMALLAVGLALVAACSDSSETTTTTTEAPATVVTTAPPAPATGSGAAATTATTTTTTTTVAPFSLPEFTIVDRTEDNVLVAAVPPGTYSDIDLQNLVNVIVERFAPVEGLHIVDDESISGLVLADSVSEADQSRLDDHYFLRLEDGFRMVFLGPFAGIDDVILGS